MTAYAVVILPIFISTSHYADELCWNGWTLVILHNFFEHRTAVAATPELTSVVCIVFHPRPRLRGWRPLLEWTPPVVIP